LLFFELLSDLVKIENILFIVKNGAAISEVRSPLNIKQKEKWITLGDNDGPAHMHINSELINSAKFVQEQKPEKISFSVRFSDSDGIRILAVFFTKMYDEDMVLISDRKNIYDTLDQKYSSKI
jgi:putative heme iron utilization protein